MVIVQATMWPGGSQAGAYELLNVSVSNRSSPGDERESYMAHVIARPNPWLGITGYDADVEVTGHIRQDGFAPLLMAVLNAAHPDQDASGVLPPARVLARLSLQDAAAFDALLRSRP